MPSLSYFADLYLSAYRTLCSRKTHTPAIYAVFLSTICGIALASKTGPTVLYTSSESNKFTSVFPPQPWLPRFPSFHTRNSEPDGQCTSEKPVEISEPTSARINAITPEKTSPMTVPATEYRSTSLNTRDGTLQLLLTAKKAHGVYKKISSATAHAAGQHFDEQPSVVNSLTPPTSAINSVSPQYSLTGSPISWHGGEIMAKSINVYYVWYGNWAASSQHILRGFINSFATRTYPSDNSVHSWFDIMLQYKDNMNYVHQYLVLADEFSDSYSQGRALRGDNAVAAIVQRAIRAGLGGAGGDPFGAYIVLTWSDVSQSGSQGSFCNEYCGWHDNYASGSTHIKYAFVGYGPSDCGCSSGYPSINNDDSADGAVNVLAHELAEMITDPLGTAWFDVKGNEAADKCAGIYSTEAGQMHQLKSGGFYNLVGTGNWKFLIQALWDRYSQACRLQSQWYYEALSLNVGAYYSFFAKRTYLGLEGTVQAADPLGGGCTNWQNFAAMNIRWNVKDGKPNHLGCGRVYLWNQFSCWGR
eukprot:TRINITY_DN3521_c0_g1_i12.p1 TRINITY_DN3521_c0_g1~~TRINITY_DN3521_c0_g1_i12.p1  ORF type:complete len:529 (+),score=-2.21 TRINITY_DN3521_c0_g1_i12:450-2036(+)